MLIAKLGFEGNILSFFCGDGTNCCIVGWPQSKSYNCSFINCWAWDFNSFLGHLWYSYPSDLYSYLEISSFLSYLGDMDFSFNHCFCYYCFFNNFLARWGSILPFIVVSSYFLHLFNKVFFSSSSLNFDIRIALMVVLVFGYFSFLGEMRVGFKGLLFLMNLSLRLYLLLSSWSYYAYFFFSCDSSPSNGNHFWNKIYRIMAKGHTSFFRYLLVVLSIIYF